VNTAIINLAYLLAAVMFILGIKGLSHPRTAVRGNLIGATGMLLAIVTTLLSREVFGSGMSAFVLIFGAILVGGTIGAILATRIQMTAMPQMVALLNGFGGGASVLVAGAAFIDAPDPSLQLTIAAVASGLIGAVTFWGSLVAFDKLQELLLKGDPIHFPPSRSSPSRWPARRCSWAPCSCATRPTWRSTWCWWRSRRCWACCSRSRSAAPTCRW
jgi:H+-translocating NAD(P) transhydrogenase subunit beta